MTNSVYIYRKLLFIAFLLLTIPIVNANDSFELKFKEISSKDGLPGNDVQKVYQDRDGYIWIASREGLSQFNGYNIKTYKSDMYNVDLLTSNNILSLAEDFNHRLWIGTHNGLNMLDKTTSKIIQINKEVLKNNPIPTMIVTKDGKLLLGTDQGLFEYIYESDSCIVYNRDNTGDVLPQTSVKALLEDSRGDIWIGTWNEGLYRYDHESKDYYSYPRMNPRHSAHVIFEDSRKRIWVGTWGEGLFLLDNIYDPPRTTWKIFKRDKNNPHSLLDDIIYDISEDINNNSLWVGNRSGLSVLPFNSSSFTNYYPDNTNENSISGNEVNSIIRDTQGGMWLGMIGSGVNFANTNKPIFNLDPLNNIKQSLTSNSVRSILVDSDNLMWLGIGTYGLVLKNRNTGEVTHYLQSKDFSSFSIPTVMSIMESPSTGKIWIGTYDAGIFVYDKTRPEGERVQNFVQENTTWLPSSCVYSIKEDSKKNIWIGTRFGLSMLSYNGNYLRFDTISIGNKSMKTTSINSIEEGPDGEIWVATSNNGIFVVKKNDKGSQEFVFEHFSINNGSVNSMSSMCIYKDTQNQIWAGIEGGGLNKYDRKKNKFISIHKEWNLPGDAIFSILDDRNGSLWLSSNAGLIRMDIQNDTLGTKNYRLYTTSDGLQDNIFNRNAAYITESGELFFGGHKGYNYFYPSQVKDQVEVSPIIITDIKIFNQSWENLDTKLRNQISELSPEFTKKIKLDYKNNNFSIEFSALGYFNPAQNKYAYKLEGFDSNWVYTDASRRFAYYNNLSAGKYKFYLKAANSNGIWNKMAVPLEIVILPPPWATWWAYLIYISVSIILLYVIYRTGRYRLRFRNELHLRELEQAKLEEVNHAKLQFFTNITHELLTPLTIISAALDELKVSIPEGKNHYQVMTNNVNRLIRLLQQILEFRKAETGNLKLKVSKGDLAAFLHNEVESFRPLMKKKKIHFSIVANPEPFPAYFDSDKIDKILYNLLSNAAKYNNIGGTIWVDLSLDETGFYAILSIKDNGTGISKEAQSTLFKRFYEGNHRKFNTIGTGIGLSLTKDLVELHQGTITVESDIDKGTCFRVLVPIKKEAYKENEIDDVEMVSFPALIFDETKEEQKPIKDKAYTLLLLEDNEELLNLMVKLLSVEYKIITGYTGKDGIDIIEQENIDLIVSDVMMPEMDGIELCKYVKSNFETCHIPVILLTAKKTEGDRILAYDSGADAFISKPFNLSLLHSRIENLLKSKERVTRDFKKQLVFEAQELNYTSIDEEFIQKAIECVHRHLDDPRFDHQQFIEEMGASKSTLHRKLKSLTGLNTSAFIRNIRLKAACQILEDKKHIRISELAYAVGFNDPKYFSACFKKELGMQPSEYMARFTMDSVVSDKK